MHYFLSSSDVKTLRQEESEYQEGTCAADGSISQILQEKNPVDEQMFHSLGLFDNLHYTFRPANMH